jgi:hypothetical protein
MVAVLFADEDVGALDDLRKMCAERCHDWLPTFVRGGAAALERMGTAPFDAPVAGGRLVDMEDQPFYVGPNSPNRRPSGSHLRTPPGGCVDDARQQVMSTPLQSWRPSCWTHVHPGLVLRSRS